jgi:hypothetical protein
MDLNLLNSRFKVKMIHLGIVKLNIKFIPTFCYLLCVFLFITEFFSDIYLDNDLIVKLFRNLKLVDI